MVGNWFTDEFIVDDEGKGVADSSNREDVIASEAAPKGWSGTGGKGVPLAGVEA